MKYLLFPIVVFYAVFASSIIAVTKMFDDVWAEVMPNFYSRFWKWFNIALWTQYYPYAGYYSEDGIKYKWHWDHPNIKGIHSHDGWDFLN